MQPPILRTRFERGCYGARVTEGDRTAEIARHIAASRGHPGLIDALETLTPSELSSVVMHALRRIALERDLPDIAARSEQTPMLQPSSCDARALLEIDRQAFASASRFEAIDLSPLMPLGAASSTGIDPNNVLAGARQAEVAGDPTIAQALESGRRRRRARDQIVRLASSQRVVRLQPFDVPGYTPHFRIFTLASAGRDTGDERFEREELLAHLDAWLHFFAALAADGHPIGPVRVEVSDTRVVRALIEARGVDPIAVAEAVRGHRPGSGERLLADAGVIVPRSLDDLEREPAGAPFLPRLRKLEAEVFGPLAERHPGAELAFDLGRLHALSYYCGPTFKLVIGAQRRAIGDGGFLDWTQRLLSDRKERMLASAVGTEALARTVPPAPRPGPSKALAVEVFTSGIWKLSSVLLSRGGRALAVDPGYFPRELSALAERARAHGRVDAVVFTHGHWDHVIGWRTFPGAEVLGSPDLAEAVASGSERAREDLDGARQFDGRWYVERPEPLGWPARIRPLTPGARLDLGGAAIEAIHLPGHSPDGLGLVIPDRGLLIAGDYLSPEEIPFVDDLDAYRATLRRLIELLESLDLVIPGHGPRLDRAAARSIARADLEYLDRLADPAEEPDAVPLPRAAEVPGMRDHHRENVLKSRAER